MKKPKIARISVSLPADLVRQADQEAARLGRSRSWVIAEALRGRGAAPSEPVSSVRDSAGSPYALGLAGLDPMRAEQLRRDLTLSPLERLRASDDAVRLSELARPRQPLKRVIFFDRFEDYLHWKDFGRLT